MQKIEIVKITSEQILHECAAILVKAYNSEPWNDEWTQETAYRKLDCFYNSPRFTGLAAYKNGALSGACIGNIEPYYTGDYFYLKEMFVLPTVQRSGIGNALLEALKAELAAANIGQIILFTSGAFFPAGFYQRAGFAVMEGMVMMHYDSSSSQ